MRNLITTLAALLIFMGLLLVWTAVQDLTDMLELLVFVHLL